MNNDDLQLRASNPDCSVWVSASAGTGKTKILTDRVLRLLLSGASPQKILCLTFTNAAADEMQARIHCKLEEWARADDDKLRSELYALIGLVPADETLEYARAIYQQLLNCQNTINVYTIHSFCQKILKTFPIEAGLSPAFQILDDITSREILNVLKYQIYTEHVSEQVAYFLGANFHEITLNDIVNEIINNRLKFKNLFAQSDIAVSKRELECKEEYCDDYLIRIRDDLRQLIVLFGNPIPLPDNLISFFLTNDGNKRKKLITRNIDLNNSEFNRKLYGIQELVYQFDQSVKTKKMIEYSNILLDLAKAIITAYDKHKHQKNLLDYDDLIFYTKELLTAKETKDWVLYKLDGGIDHLLVDEAQDTSPEQWQIIESLIVEFYAGDSITKHRTIFVVGDEKQSIFSFQGADTNSFNKVRDYLKSRLFEANKIFEVINLAVSYRSRSAVLEAVHKVFSQIKNNAPKLFVANNQHILPVYNTNDCNGRVEIWPLATMQKDQELFWPLPHDYDDSSSSPVQNLALQIATFIKDQLSNGALNLSTQRPLGPGDFMILVRKRDILSAELIKQLRSRDIAVAGVDRMLISQNLSVIDLISAAKFALAPDDDLNLAHLIKSPIIGGAEDDLYRLAATRHNLSIWNVLQNNADINNVDHYQKLYAKLNTICDIYKYTHAGNFFHIIVNSFSLRKTFLEINGGDDDDAINELLYISYNYASTVNISLQAFIYWFDANEIEVQRSIENSDKVRIMTVHASKGLQAPVVILCDTTTVPVSQSKFIWKDYDQVFYSIAADQAPQILKELKEDVYIKDLQEYIRLLYVAMTRSKDHLVICGYNKCEKLSEYCWYSLVSNAMKSICAQGENGVFVYGDLQQIYQGLAGAQNIVDVSNIISPRSESLHELSNNSAFLYYNNLTAVRNAPTTTLLSISYNYFQYGRIFHKILEDSIKSQSINKMPLHPLIATLPAQLKDKMFASILLILANHEFIDIISKEANTEMNIGMWQDNSARIGRIDLLTVSQDQVTIIDYKSDSHPPSNQDFISTDYINQLNFYRSIVREIYPNHKIICKILWLENGHLMTI